MPPNKETATPAPTHGSTLSLTSLPLEILGNVLIELPTDDIKTMLRVNKELSKAVQANLAYVGRAIAAQHRHRLKDGIDRFDFAGVEFHAALRMFARGFGHYRGGLPPVSDIWLEWSALFGELWHRCNPARNAPLPTVVSVVRLLISVSGSSLRDYDNSPDGAEQGLAPLVRRLASQEQSDWSRVVLEQQEEDFEPIVMDFIMNHIRTKATRPTEGGACEHFNKAHWYTLNSADCSFVGIPEHVALESVSFSLPKPHGARMLHAARTKGHLGDFARAVLLEMITPPVPKCPYVRNRYPLPGSRH